MSYTVTKIAPDVYKVEQPMYGFVATPPMYMYYDIARRLRSESVDFPDSILTRPLSTLELAYFTDWMLPKVVN